MSDRRAHTTLPRRPHRRALRWALPVAAALHAAAILWLAFPTPQDEESRRSMMVVPLPEVDVDRRPAGPGAPPRADDTTPASQAEAARPVVATPIEMADAPESETIAPTGLQDLRLPVQPLVVGPRGQVQRQSAPSDDGRRLAIARAESIVNARLAEFGVKARPASGPVSLANGGITIAIPWQGFVREDRADEVWRRERCEGGDEGEADQPGEAEGRASQCG